MCVLEADVTKVLYSLPRGGRGDGGVNPGDEATCMPCDAPTEGEADLSHSQAASATPLLQPAVARVGESAEPRALDAISNSSGLLGALGRMHV